VTQEKGQTITFNTGRMRSQRTTAFPSAFLPQDQPEEKLHHPTHGRRSEKHKPKHIDLMLETIRREQEARESRVRPRRSGFDAMTERTLEMSLSGSMADGDNTTTNLYVGNLAPDLNEEILKREFGRFGPVASVKIMWPRDEDQIKRGSNVGFVAFMDRESAARCIENLNGEKLHGLELRIGWGKSVPLPSATSTSQNPEPPPPAAPPEQPMEISKDLSFDQEVEVSIPQDLHQRYIIDTLAAFVMKDGAKFEQLVKQKESNNPAFAFMLDNGSAENIYYRWKLFTLVQGDSMTRWRLEPFYMIDGGPVWKPPHMCVGDGSQLTAAQRGEGIAKRKLLSDLERNRFEEMLAKLSGNRDSVCDAMVFALNNAEAAEEVVEMLMLSLCQLETSVTAKIARLFVVSDILHNSSASVRNASQYRTIFQEHLPAVFESFRAVYASLHDKKDLQEAIKKNVLRILRVWRNWYIFSTDYLNGLQSTFLALPQSDEEIAGGLQKLEGMSMEEIERKCRFNGLSLEGGIGQQKMRCARLDAYLQGNAAQPAQKKQKSKSKRQAPSKSVKREATRTKKSTEVKTSTWVSVEEEQEKKPAVPISQWLQEKQQQSEMTVAHVGSTEQKPVPKPNVEGPDFDMFEAEDAEAKKLTEQAPDSAASEQRHAKKPRTGQGD